MCVLIFFHLFFSWRNADYNLISDIALKRVKQDLTMHGAQVCSSIAAATHLVVVSVLQNYNFDILYKRY
jgi:DNA ligase-4